jgi:5-methylcytosine-specific restriction endonuclease McrA
MRSVIHVPYSRWEIFQRDNFVCHICGAPIDMNALAPTPMSPSIDHVIPIKLGGADTEDNVKAAHFICNSKKSDRLMQ